MYHSTWDLEVHAREMQRRWLHEADRARKVEAAQQRGVRPRVSAARFNVARFMTALRTTLSPRPSALVGAAAPRPTGAAAVPLPLEELRLRPDARSSGLSQPYAGMVVVARGTSAQSAVQRCAAGDC